ncbi:hypothetical protein [Nocardioides deserti]|uniref:Uncharacterized protein n=1 Tax=Nocardioides deserti TaxID=1588644 RepID=A0ABR6U891_9ACTN|nr:hypothetical protein [Nocardioides deserti]MBC2960505.1 hypothetical protein [Nocardioides deserti]GGO71181.1 hypothetical protein GCM10012276_11550 [Nocardioides deserti]
MNRHLLLLLSALLLVLVPAPVALADTPDPAAPIDVGLSGHLAEGDDYHRPRPLTDGVAPKYW